MPSNSTAFDSEAFLKAVLKTHTPQQAQSMTNDAASVDSPQVVEAPVDQPASDARDIIDRQRDTSRQPSESSRRQRSRSRSRDRRRSRSRDRRRRSRSRSRDYRRRKSRSRSRRRSRSRDYRRRSRSPARRYGGRGGYGGRPRRPDRFRPPPMSVESYELEVERLSRTINVSRLNPKVSERDLIQFLEKQEIGSVRDAQIVRDNRTGVSKGVAYVEFYEREAIEKALNLSGLRILGQPCQVQSTDTEKRLLEQQMALQGEVLSGNVAGGTVAKKDDPLDRRVSVSGLHVGLSESDVKMVFEPFGLIEMVRLELEPNGTSKGLASIHFRKLEDAQTAVEKMNGFDLAGHSLRVTFVEKPKPTKSDEQTYGFRDGEKLDETEAGLGFVSRTELMARLARDPAEIDAGRPNTVSGASANGADGRRGVPTCNCVLKNMFDPAEETDPNWDAEIRDDVREECSHFGAVRHIYVDKHSPDGLVYLRFDAVEACAAAVEKLDGRWFGKKKVEANFIVDSIYLMQFPDAK